MKITTSIKIDKDTKEEAAELATELGISFSAVVNGMLKTFVRERRIVLGVMPEINAKTQKEYKEILKDIGEDRNISVAYKNVDELRKALNA